MEKIYIDIIDQLPRRTDNEHWQVVFNELKKATQQGSQKKMPYPSRLKPSDPEPDEGYYYFINGILDSIRHGESDYCFRISHIIDLLQYEHRLSAVWLPQYKCYRVFLASEN